MFRSTFDLEVNSFERRLEVRVAGSTAELNRATRGDPERSLDRFRGFSFDSRSLCSRVRHGVYIGSSPRFIEPKKLGLFSLVKRRSRDPVSASSL